VVRKHTIYVYLLNEGTVCARPTSGIHLGDNMYKLLATHDYDPSLEDWEFPPGSIVNCELHRFASAMDEEVLVAKSLVV